MINAEGANSFYELVNGLFEDKTLDWNNGRPDLEMVDRYYLHKQNERCTSLKPAQPPYRSENQPIW